jgi:hypothetical protein
VKQTPLDGRSGIDERAEDRPEPERLVVVVGENRQRGPSSGRKVRRLRLASHRSASGAGSAEGSVVTGRHGRAGLEMEVAGAGVLVVRDGGGSP